MVAEDGEVTDAVALRGVQVFRKHVPCKRQQCGSISVGRS